MKLWIATGNKGKWEEYKLLLEKHVPGLELHLQSELKTFSQPPENGKTFLENAQIKARALSAMVPDAWVLGEDAGLEVEGLGGLPGLHTARYAGPKATDIENVTKLVKIMALKPMPNRNAQFVCTTVIRPPAQIVAAGEEKEWAFTGLLKGEIAKKPVGVLGFGYDPVFVPEGQIQTLGELGPAFKIKNSHRAQASLHFIQKLKEKGHLL